MFEDNPQRFTPRFPAKRRRLADASQICPRYVGKRQHNIPQKAEATDEKRNAHEIAATISSHHQQQQQQPPPPPPPGGSRGRKQKKGGGGKKKKNNNKGAVSGSRGAHARDQTWTDWFRERG